MSSVIWSFIDAIFGFDVTVPLSAASIFTSYTDFLNVAFTFTSDVGIVKLLFSTFTSCPSASFTVIVSTS